MVQILDTTLREGEQTPGVYFDSHIKLAIAELLDQIGVDIIEAGHPLVSQDIYQAVKQIASIKLKAKICAHGRSLKKDVDIALECGVNFLGIFFCAGYHISSCICYTNNISTSFNSSNRCLNNITKLRSYSIFWSESNQ